MQRFFQKTVIVTGAGSGIGAATAKRFAAEGANVVLSGRTVHKLEAVAGELPAERTLVVPGDVSVSDDDHRLVSEAVARFGALHVLVNNAGTVDFDPIDRFARETWDKIMATNLTGLFMLTQAGWPYLKAASGNVVNVSSVSGLGGDWLGFAYNASKGGVSNFTRALALDYRDSSVRVNAVAPTLTRSDMSSGAFQNEALLERFFERIPMGRAGEPEDVAAAIAWLASDDAAFINGVVLPVDGGLSASNGQPPLR